VASPWLFYVKEKVMGWMFRKCSMQELIQDRLGYDCIEHERKVIAHALRGSVLWTVNQITHRETGASDVFIGCDLLRKDGEWCGYKDMEESMGPHHYSCPMKFLDMAPERNPVWRERVREYHRQRARRFSVGQRVEVIGCTVPWVRITSTNPLTGEYGGVHYNLKRSLLGEVLPDAEAPDGQFLTGPAKSSDRQENAVTAM